MAVVFGTTQYDIPFHTQFRVIAITFASRLLLKFPSFRANVPRDAQQSVTEPTIRNRRHHFDCSNRDAAELPYVFRESFIERSTASRFAPHLAHEQFRGECSDLFFAMGIIPSIDVGLVSEYEAAPHCRVGGHPLTYRIRVRSYPTQHFREELLGLVILLYKLLRRAGAGGSEKGSRRAVPVR